MNKLRYPLTISWKTFALHTSTQTVTASLFLAFFLLIFHFDSSSNGSVILPWLITFAITSFLFAVAHTFLQRTQLLTLYNKQYRVLTLSYPKKPSFYFWADLRPVLASVFTSMLLAQLISVLIALAIVRPTNVIAVQIIAGAILTTFVSTGVFLIAITLGIYLSNNSAALLTAFVASMMVANGFANGPGGGSLVVLTALAIPLFFAGVAAIVALAKWLNKQELM